MAASIASRLLAQTPGGRPLLALTVALGVGQVVAWVAVVRLFAWAASTLILGPAGARPARAELAALLAAVLARAACAAGLEAAGRALSARVARRVRQALYGQLLLLGPVHARGERTGELATLASTGIDRLDAYVARYLPLTASSVLAPGVILVAIAPIDPLSAAILVATAPVVPLLLALAGRSTQRRAARQWTALALLGAHFLDTLQGLPTLKLFGRSRRAAQLVGEVGREYRERTMRVLRSAFLSGFVLEFASGASIAILAVALAVRMLAGNATLETSLAVLLLAPEFYRPLKQLGEQRHAAMEGRVAAERILEILGRPIPAPSPRRPNIARCAPPPISFRGVSYAYPGSARPALHDLSLHLPAGSCTALVGPSGSGKSTLVAMLLRFLHPDAGAIYIGDLLLGELEVGAWRRGVALVTQRPAIFRGTVEANVRMARPDAAGGDLERALDLAGARELVDGLRGGLGAILGEGGATLSAGEAQRIALARAFLRDAPVVVLDEPTASLDPEHEEAVAAALRRLRRDRTTLIVAHRVTTAASADFVAVLEHGRVVDHGTHADLVARSRLYARMVGPLRVA